MKRLLILPLLLALSGCATFQKVESFVAPILSVSVTPKELYVATSAFDVAKPFASAYFRACAPYVNLTTHRALSTAPVPCSDANRRIVFASVRSGTAARNQAETYLGTGASAPAAIYNTLMAAVNGLKSTAQGAAQ